MIIEMPHVSRQLFGTPGLCGQRRQSLQPANQSIPQRRTCMALLGNLLGTVDGVLGTVEGLLGGVTGSLNGTTGSLGGVTGLLGGTASTATGDPSHTLDLG